MAKQQRDLAKEAHWRGVFQQFAASGLSVRGFCRRESLSEANFYAWRRTLAERDQPYDDRAGTASSPTPPPHAPAFVPVRLAPARASVRESAIEPGFSHGSSLALELTNGRLLRLPLTTSPVWLAELLLALEARGAQ
jgi:hypothetical protein